MEEKRLQKGSEFQTFLSELLTQHKDKYNYVHVLTCDVMSA